MSSANCPCGRPQPYAECCQPLHWGKHKPADAETLMRSRYSAFVNKEVDYLLNTLHSTQRRADDRKTLLQTCQSTQWLGLKIIKTQNQSKRATVEFVAFYADQPLGQLHERSHFIYQEGNWFYLDGEILPTLKLSRNELCICGSGNKFKRCHGR